MCVLRVAGSLRRLQSGSPEGSCFGGSTWHFTNSSTNLSSSLAYLNCNSNAWVFASAYHIHPIVNKLEYFMCYFFMEVRGELRSGPH